MDPEQTQDDFQKELIELFGQEAQEWLLQIHSALTELESQPNLERHAQLVDAIVRGITSLGGSAATINLPEVERATFALLPFMDAVKDRTTVTAQDFAMVREQFRMVVASVKGATGIALEIELLPEATSAPEPAIDFLTLLNALHALHERHAIDAGASRSLIPLVLQRVEHEARQGAGQIQYATFQQILRDLHTADAQCLEALRQELPLMAQHVSRLRAEGLGTAEPEHPRGLALQRLEYLQSVAKQANATMLVTFLSGLQNFLTLLFQRRTNVGGQRLQSVERRILAMASMVDEWIETGHQELDQMSQLVPAA
ncbi:MAG: hypothetical protein JSR62_17550 [Nitrospira sp.]|nr:hypothetical protein [Nitrospira sp.]